MRLRSPAFSLAMRLFSFCRSRFSTIWLEREAGVADLHDAVVIEHAAVLDLLVRALDEAVLVDARVAGQRRDQADVRTFRRLDRADAAVVRRVNVADFESGALAGETARSQGPTDGACA